MKVLVIGSGGREHVLTWKIAQSPKVDKIYCAPGNGGMAKIAECVDLSVEDIDGCVKFAREKGIDLTVVGPEVPLVMGMTDAFEKEGMRVFGPNAKCAEFEGSKAFTKDFLLRHNIPTAAYKEYTDLNEIMKDIGVYGFPMVIKADGLAAGKGVLIVENEQEAKDGINMIMADHEFGDAGDKVVVEEFLTGREASMLCFVDGNVIVPMESAQDYKRAYDHDEGLNTGGMGTYSPNVLFDNEVLNKRIEETILTPIIEGFKADGMDFKGILFIGLMIENDMPKVLEFNVRFGDPEAQSVLMRMDSDLVDIMEACIDGKLADCDIKWKDEAAVTVVLASGGYPGPYKKGLEITGIEDVEGCEVFHAGTALKDGKLVTSGGRVLCVSALGEDREAARAKVYSQVDKIKFDGARYRTDIAKMD
ncbi:phosphoribosylamine--glycine ligase [Eubacterium maltosivorans]|uniref:phosphoribosylamine--glycine ligase n=1 Tax=Eubacterium maltosivorans TaxID=2041044 RepID=UPI0008844EEB|nr:phosphoribosylamine--glycine ligase [Eubacterium maltosivorans]WPK79309.1 Phosphoribosylamine--glycine ligase [Eubacterium maltosivorans]SDP83878.1 phosphoribosylamine--glycine ligase [Eubacterium maltosivorans]